MQDAKKSPKIRYLRTIAQLCRARIFANKACIGNQKKNLLNSSISPTCPHNMVNFSPIAAEILVWGTPANFIGFRVLAALLHGTLVVGVGQTLQHWEEGTTCIRQGGHHVVIGPHSSCLLTFSMHCELLRLPSLNTDLSSLCQLRPATLPLLCF